MIMEKKSKSLIVLAILAIVLAGCYPQGPEYIEDMDVVITDYEPSYDFASKGTYALPDRIVKITGDVVQGDEPQFIPDATASLILETDSRVEHLAHDRIITHAQPRVDRKVEIFAP